MDRWTRGMTIIVVVLWFVLTGAAGAYLFYFPPW